MASKKTNTLTINDYNEEKGWLDSRLASSRARREETFRREKAASEEETARALRRKYLENRLSAKRLPQIAAARGLSGGAVRNAFRGLTGEYSAVRENLTAERDGAIAKLVEEYSQGEAKDSESYAEKLAALRKKYAEVLALEELKKKYASMYSSSGYTKPRNTRVIVIGANR